MLFDPTRHESLTTTAWDEGRARGAIEWIVRDVEARVSPKGLWPAHPLDSDHAETFHSLYFGACGVVWALRRLESQGAVTLTGDYGPTAAGPLRKGSNLCHGTGGNGYAFLKLFRRTGDAKWLDRARAFAAHGIAQTASAQETYGRLRYSLWTGDPGFAIYLWDCIRGTDRFPSLDNFFD